jgi:hypothetical protein
MLPVRDNKLFLFFVFRKKFLLENAVAAVVAGPVAGLLPHRVQAFRCELLIRKHKTGDEKWVADFQLCRALCAFLRRL